MKRKLVLALLVGVVAAQTPGAAIAAAAPRAVVGAPLAAAPVDPRDETKVPHYFGPYPNWANSPQVLANAVVTLTNGGGAGAEATAVVDPKTGAISAINVTSPGSGYISPPDVVITSPGVVPTTPAAATAAISAGVITGITVDEAGFGFTTPQVTLTGGNPTPGMEAHALASGGVDNLTLTDGGTGYALAPMVRISLPDLPDGVQATGTATMDGAGVVTGVEVVEAGSGYTSAPTVTILDGTTENPTGATVTATIGIGRVDITDGGEGYDSAPQVAILDAGGVDRGASGTAAVAVRGAVTGITVGTPGAGYLTPGLKKFVDTLPGLTSDQANDLGQYIPVAVPDTTTYPGTDYYEIAVVQYRMKFHRDLPATLLRGYVQLATNVVPGHHVALSNANLDPAAPAMPIAGYFGVDNPHYLGPTIVATKDKPVRILFRNLLPTEVSGDLFLPTDTSMMGAGEGPDAMMLDPNGVPMDMAMDEGTVTDGVRNPACGNTPKPRTCYSENRATLHLHGGITPWISDGTPHQWITPNGEDTAYPRGVSVSNVPDMPDPGPGAQTFFYTNQQSARLMFYHDHAWGITRLNVYAGEAAAYLLTDEIEQELISPTGALAGMGMGTPLVVQDKTFVPNADKMRQLDPTWDASKWGGEGSLWTPHVYMPAQNPGQNRGSNPFGRWMYGPWFWPPAKDAKYPPVANPYYDPACDPNVQPFCEPAQIPSTPNNSVGMEAFQDTPVVNGTAYPKTTVDPKAYRYRILNGSNDRFWNLQWYVADPTTGTLSEVALKPAELEAAQTDPVVFPTPDTTKSPAGPKWIQIGTEGGFLPTPVTVPNQPITWITDPTRFDVGNVDKHSLLLSPAERADVIVDFSQYRGKTLILYNDAPAAFPARVPGYDYYTGGPDLSPVGAPTTLPGYGPNTRTIMQVKVSTAAPDVAFDRPNTTADRMGALNAAFAHHLDAAGNPAGVFEKGSNPIIVGQSDYNTAYGTDFVSAGHCNSPINPSPRCDGFARINEQGGDTFKFDTLAGPQVTLPFQPKGIHDEMNSASFDQWGRMTANMGLEAPGATPNLQKIVLYPFVNPPTEILDSSGLPSSLNVTPITAGNDGTQLWKITHNGVDTHPIHFHLYDVQVINRVTWDNIIMPPEPTELGWKDTVRVSPLEDTIVALRPIVPTLPFAVPDSRRPLNPMMPLGARGSQNGQLGVEAGFNNTDVNGNPIAPIINEVIDFGWEYVVHCHILSHEEMDMMRPVTVHVPRAVPPAPVLAFRRGSVILEWTDGTPVDYANPSTWTNPGTAEIGYRIERALVTDGVAGPFAEIAKVGANTVTHTDLPADPTQIYDYRVFAYNQAGETSSNVIRVEGIPAAPTALTAVVQPEPALPSGSQVLVSWTNNAVNATNVVVERAVNGGAFNVLATLAPDQQNHLDTTVSPGTYSYRVRAIGPTGPSAYAGPVDAVVTTAASTTVALGSPNPSLVGQDVTITATVSSAAAAATPTGTVTFTVNGVDTVVGVDAVGVATHPLTGLAAGAYPVTATYSGDSTFAASNATMTQTVNKAATTTAVVSSVNPSRVGDAVTFTATVSPAPAAGTVQFMVDGVMVSEVAVTGGLATYATTGLTEGAHIITASYSGDPALLASTSPDLTQNVGPALRATRTVLTSNSNPSTYLGNVTFTATVRPVTGIGIPTGTVQFVIDGANVGTPVLLNVNGRATLATRTLTAGSHNVIAVYSGSDVFSGGASASWTQLVNQAPTTLTVTSNRNPSLYGQNVTFAARVVPASATGTVTFTIDGVPTGGPVPVTAGVARLAINSLVVGSHTVSAVYSGSANFLPSASAPITQTVNAALARTTIMTSGSPAIFGTAVILTATVRATTNAAVFGTGLVQFTVDGVNVGAPVVLNGSGQASLAISTLPVGRHTVKAVFAGDGYLLSSTSAARALRIR